MIESAFSQSLSIIKDTWSIWLPFAALFLSFHKWLEYKRSKWIREQEMALLEIHLPIEQLKSPAGMEIVFQILHQPGVGSLSDVFYSGRVRMWSSLEIVSDGGQVHLYIQVNKKIRGLLESSLYAQYPSIEIHEVPDYALGFHYDLSKYEFGKFSHLVFTKPDAYPIKTYVDYGLDKDPDEEYKNDPLSAVFEFLGSLKPGEQAWIQIVLRAHVKETLKYGRLFPKPDWKDAAGAEIKEILKKAKLQTDVAPDKYDPKYLTDAQKDAVKAIERSLEKSAFDAMIRVAYFAEKGSLNKNNIGGILGVLKQFSSQTLNGFKPSGYDFDYPWQDFKDMRKKKIEQEFLDAYKRRLLEFNDEKPFILTTEELATLFHFPSSTVAATPSLRRVPSKKVEAPANLPT